MLTLLNSPNVLISLLDRFFNVKDIGISKVRSVVNESSPNDLVPAFFYLEKYLSSNVSQISDPEALIHLQDGFQLISIISSKIPLAVLLNGIFDINSGLNQPHWLLHTFYMPTSKRIARLQSYTKPFLVYGFVLTCPLLAESGTLQSNIMVELEIDPSFQTNCLAHFKRLLLTRAPISNFRELIMFSNAKNLLTQAIIEIIYELNQSTESQEKLLFSCSSIFLYINAFTLTNDINGQMLCEFLQSCPFLSPFCVLAIVNHIQINLFLYNLLIPRNNLIKDDSSNNGHYFVVDLTNENILSPFLVHVPTILNNYFSSEQGKDEKNLTYHKNLQINEFLTNIHLSNCSIINKLKYTLNVAIEQSLDALSICCMEITLLNYIVTALKRSLEDFSKKKMFTTTFCNFFANIFNFLTPTFSEKMHRIFFELGNAKPYTTNLIMKGSLLYVFPSLLNSSTNDAIIPFCIQALKWEESKTSALFLLTKLLASNPPKISSKVYEVIKSMNNLSPNILANLILIDALSHPYYTTTAKDKVNDTQFCDFLIQSTPLSLSLYNGYYIIESVNIEKFPFGEEMLSEVFVLISKLQPSNALKELSGYLKDDNAFIIFQILIYTHFMKSREFILSFFEAIKQFLTKEPDQPDNLDGLQLHNKHLFLYIGQCFLERIIAFGFCDVALTLIDYIAPILRNDSSPLHWMINFLKRCRHNLTNELKLKLTDILKSLPYANEYFIPLSQDATYRITKTIVPNPGDIILTSPDIISHEYQSLVDHVIAFALCSIMLSTLEISQIIKHLLEPNTNLCRPWENRNECCLVIAKLTTGLSFDIAYQYFLSLLDLPCCETSVSCGQMVLMCCNIDLYQTVCKNCKSIIKLDANRLDYFIHIVMPSIRRLHSDDATVISFLCGILESIDDKTKDELKETVIDAVGLVYIKMELFKYRSTLIGSIRHLDPVFRAMIASTLEVGDCNYISFSKAAKKWHNI